MNELRDGIVRAAESDNNEMFAYTWLVTEYYIEVCATSGVHIEIH
jgi:hypothetical protein